MDTRVIAALAQHFAGTLDITIQVAAGLHAPQTDGHTIFLPLADVQEDAAILLGKVLHEAYHVKWTTPLFTARRLALVGITGGLEQDLLNVLEDIRIDRQAMADYAGARFLLQRGLERLLPPPVPEPRLIGVLKHLILVGEGFGWLSYDPQAQAWVQTQWPVLETILQDYERVLHQGSPRRWRSTLAAVKQCLERLKETLGEFLDPSTWAADFHHCCAVLEAEIPAPPAERASATLPQGTRARAQALAAIRKALATGTLPRLGEVFDLHLHGLDHAVEQGLLHLQHGILPAETVSALQDLLQTRLRRSVAGETGRLNPRVLSRLPFDAALTPFITEEVLQVEAARVLFVLDASSSMHTRHTEATLKTKAESVADCLVTLGQLFERLQQEDYDMNWAVISFAGDVQVLRAFTARRMPEEVARQYLAWRQPATRLWGGLAAAHRLLDQEAPQTRQLVIVLTDAELDGKDMQQLHTGLRPEVQYLFLRVGTRLQRFAEPRLQALYDRLFQHGLHAVDDLSPALVKAMEAMMSWH